MNLLPKKTDSKRITRTLAALVIISFSIGCQTGLCRTTEDHLDPLSILPLNEMKKPVKKNGTRVSEEKQMIQVTPVIEIPKEVPKSLKLQNTPWALDFNQDNTIFISKTDKQPKKEDTKNNEKKLIKESFSAVVENDKSAKKDQLRNLIQQISSIKFKKKFELNATKRQDTELIQDNLTEIIDDKTGVNEEPLENESDFEIIARIQYLKTQPEKTKKPFMLAELLYLNGYHEHAVYFYSLAIDKNGESEDFDTAWALLQKANCQKHYNPVQALKTYKQIVSEYPNSIWFQSAQANQEILSFYQEEKPEKLIELCKNQLSGS